MENITVGIIGAGLSGLISGRHCIKEGLNFVIYEQSGEYGGTWTYTEKTGLDEFGLPILSSTYKNLRSNLPKECMVLDDFPHLPSNADKSYLTQLEVLEYIQAYVKHFKILPHIKFHNHVVKVKPTENNKFVVEVRELKTNKIKSYKHEFVLVCNGHHSVPIDSKVPGIDTFPGSCIHSHVYRLPDKYKNKTVLLVGGGQSAIGIANTLHYVSKKVLASHGYTTDNEFASHVVQKPKVQKIVGNKVIFSDNSEEIVDSIILCTGYVYSFPFLSEECGISTENRHVYPLYKQIVNINHPNMAFIGLPFIAAVYFIFGIQVKYYMAYMTKRLTLPSKEKMMEELNNDIEKRKALNIAPRHYHSLDNAFQIPYTTDLAESADIPKHPPVIFKIFDDSLATKRSFKYHYNVINDETFERFVKD